MLHAPCSRSGNGQVVAAAHGGLWWEQAGLARMSPAPIETTRRMGFTPTPVNRVAWFLNGRLAHHGVDLAMAHDAWARSTNRSVLCLARGLTMAQGALNPAT